MTKADELKDADIIEPLAIDYKGEIKCVTYCPKKDPKQNKFNKDWENDVLPKWEGYLLLNPTTEQGQLDIAKYHGYTADWDTVTGTHTNDTHICKHIAIWRACMLRRDWLIMHILHGVRGNIGLVVWPKP